MAWLAVCAVLGCIQLIVTRACGYDLQPLAVYAFYLGSHVYVPGVVVLTFVQRRPISLTSSIALGIPAGFAVEIFSYLALAAADAKAWLAISPIVWLAAGAAWGLRHRSALMRVHIGSRHGGLALALSALFLATTLLAAGNMFAEAPLTAGLPQRPIFHDWVYLVSRAAAIKHLWPLEDPSLAGTALQYHYFMLVHAASASWVTGIEVTTLLLRLIIVVLGVVLVTQAYALGRLLSRSPWGGVMAAWLTVLAGELGFVAPPNESVFLGKFVRWLFVSPTFYFGVIFFGALLLALGRWQRLRRIRLRDAAWLCALAAAAAGAKATVMPVLILAVGLWALAGWWRSGRFPTRMVAGGVCLVAMGALVYSATMTSWGSGALAWAPLDVFPISKFWQAHHDAWARGLAQWLPAGAATLLASVGCAGVVLAGSEGLRLLAVPYVCSRWGGPARPLADLLGAALAASVVMGTMLRLDADGELYLLLPMRLPAAVLTAAFLVEAARALARPRERDAARMRAAGAAWARRRALRGAAILMMTVLIAGASFQTALVVARIRRPLREWLLAPPERRPDANMQRLHEALLWVRRHTEPDAVLVANTWTPASRKTDHWNAVDHTLAGVHYYYSALSERRLLVEGPNYLLHADEVRRRMELAAKLFLQREAPPADLIPASACYALLDRSVRDETSRSSVPGQRVFANERIEIYRLRGREGLPTGAAIVSHR